MQESTSKGQLGRALSFVRPHRVAVAVILVLTLAAAAVGVAEPLVLKDIFDGAGRQGGQSSILWGLGILAALAAGREVLTGVTNYMTWTTRLQVQFTLLATTVDRLHRLPLSYHRGKGVGAVMTRLDRGIQGFMTAVTELTFNALPAVAYFVLAVAVMIKLDWRLSVLVLVLVPLPGVIAARAAPIQSERQRTLLDKWSAIYSRFNEVLSGLVLVRSFAMEDVEKQRFLRGVDGANGEVVRGVVYDTRVGAAQNLAMAVARVASLGLGALLVVRGESTVGTLVAFVGYLNGLFGPVQGLTGIYKTVSTASVSLEEVFGILDSQEHLGDAPDARPVERLRGQVSFRGVGFGYDGTPSLLRGIDLEVRPGEKVALVGPSGAGKSTMMAMLQRFLDPVEGAVLVDGMDLRTLKQSSLRRHIGVVLQEPTLFNDTVRNNIAYGRPGASLAEVEAAARAANAHDFVSRLPEGYDTKVGEHGGNLSGGERQRIAIARALLMDPAILILDEATANLDAELEALVQEALERLMAGRTTFVIAHRLATVVDMDRIIVLRDGGIAESGSHDELILRDGYYARLAHLQGRGLVRRALEGQRGAAPPAVGGRTAARAPKQLPLHAVPLLPVTGR